LAKSTVVVAVQGANFARKHLQRRSNFKQHVCRGSYDSRDQWANATCFIYNSSVNTSTTLIQNAKAYLIINVSDACGLPSYVQVKIEIRGGKGTVLMVQRDIPSGLPDDQLVTSAREYRVIFLFRRALFVRAVTHRVLYRNSQYS